LEVEQVHQKAGEDPQEDLKIEIDKIVTQDPKSALKLEGKWEILLLIS